MKRAFEKWLWEDLEEEFGLQNKLSVLLEKWLNTAQEISPNERVRLHDLITIFLKYYEDWNEDELKMQFIAPLLALVNYYEIGYMPFSQRNLSATINEWEVHGRVDWVLAKGRQTPKKPFLFIHEYKAEKGKTNDPKGQLLAEMLVAQTINADKNPIYGIYIVGKDWYFVILEEKNYAVSRPYQANEAPDMDVIMKALKEVKNIIKTL